jgi:RNA polymerase sigma-70 factor (ECF subfamily)
VFDDVSDAELMSLLAGGDDLALNTLVARWRERLAAFLYRMTHDRCTALDLTQETFVRLYRSRSRYQPTAAFPSYLFTIAANLARDHARWRSRHPSVPLEESTAALLADSAASPDASAAQREEVAAVEAAIAKLPTDLREAILLFVYEDLGYSEIATITKCSPKAVETRIYRARQLLKQSLGERG